MKTFNSKVDDYMVGAADFAKPILEYLRNIIHETCPEVEEVMKWGLPHFDYKGDMMCVSWLPIKNTVPLAFTKPNL